MKIFVKATPGAKKERIERLDDSHFTVAVKEPPRDGRANDAIRRALARHLGVPPSGIRLASGFSSRRKVFEVE